jgi:hypothetical protein
MNEKSLVSLLSVSLKPRNLTCRGGRQDKNWIITFFLSVLLLWKNIAKDKKVIPDPIDDRKFQE